MFTELLQKHLLNSFILKYVVYLYTISSLRCAEEMVLISGINRRLDGDLYYFSGSVMSNNCERGNTYLVDERQCVSDHDLINNCTFVIAPLGSHMPQRIFVHININGNRSKTDLLTVDDSQTRVATATITFRDTHQQDSINPTSDCQIDSLEVYRGTNYTFDIPHDGFTITNERSIQINTEHLRYDVEDLKGELFRMYLSCSGGSGCLFFKVKGETNITNAKFDSEVPGTGKHTQHSEKTTQSTSALAMSTDTADLSVAVLDIATYAIVAIAGVLILLFVTILTATILFFCSTKEKRKRYG